MKLKKFGFLILPAILFALSSCLGDDPYNDYSEWLERNNAYIASAEAAESNGKSVYAKIIPSWDPSSYVLMRWHNDTSLTAGNLRPMDNSTINVKYLLRNIDGDTIDSSYAMTTYGDSLFQCQPSSLVTGFWIASTKMHVGDSVTAIMPYFAGYGVNGSGSVKPFSTLIFEIKLDSIVAYNSQL